MPTATFQNLATDKRARIITALLHEFSDHSLATAQVARIVKEADIARGAFYKYFADLPDAYEYLYEVALQEIHHNLPTTTQTVAVEATYAAVVNFIEQVTNSRYYALIQHHFQENEGLLPAGPAAPATMPAPAWAAMVLSHATIKEIMLHPDQQDVCLTRFHEALTALS